jgi:hypothetical protein
MFEGIPGVRGNIDLFAFGLEPGVQGGLVDGKDFVRGLVRGGRGKEG